MTITRSASAARARAASAKHAETKGQRQPEQRGGDARISRDLRPDDKTLEEHEHGDEGDSGDDSIGLSSLCAKLAAGEDWRGIDGIAYRLDDGKAKANRLREPVADLDTLPPPDREGIDYASRELATASILGSRGCPWNCSFCSIRPFYEAQGGRLRRLRSPVAVVEEMAALHYGRGVRAFLFQDDDFLATGNRARAWAGGLIHGLPVIALSSSAVAGRLALA